MGSLVLNVLIVDDEPPIRAELRYLLERDGRVGSIEEAGNGTEALEKMLAAMPDVLFLDIQMPGTSGIKLAETLGNLKNPPLVVFVTAFSEHAVSAYELDATDYILKPVEEDRLTRALDKVCAILEQRHRPSGGGVVTRLAVERGGHRAYIPASDVLYIEACADYCRVKTAAGQHMIGESISSLEKRLAGEGFLRVHRSYLANIDKVHDIEEPRPGILELRMENDGGLVPVSRRRTATVKERLGL